MNKSIKPSIQSLGGKARAASLTKKQRRDIAVNAINERWKRYREAKAKEVLASKKAAAKT